MTVSLPLSHTHVNELSLECWMTGLFSWEKELKSRVPIKSMRFNCILEFFSLLYFKEKRKTETRVRKGKGKRDTDLGGTGSILLYKTMCSKLTHRKATWASDLLSCQVHSSKSPRTAKDKWITCSQKPDSELALQAKKELPQAASSRL